MVAVIINGVTSSLGALLGVILRRGISEKVTKSLFSAIALCLMVMAIQGAVKTENILLVLVSIVLGVVLGTVIGIETRMEQCGDYLRRVLRVNGDKSFVDAFVTLSIMQIAGAMAIVGPLQAALVGDHSVLYFKSLVDSVSAFIFGAIYGLGTVPVGIAVIVYELFFFFLAGAVSPLMTPDVIRELNAVGSIIILGIAFNMLGLTKLRVGDYIPSMVVPIIYYHLIANLW